ncbi:MAG: hypothetical protein NT146_09665 [Mycobacterium sp.]|nr:hypothetical protein [Mycobacterium sp.]
MATRTKPLITAAALATAAAVAVASPAIAPNLTPTPAALSAAQVELTTFSDLLSITPAEWNDYFFVGYGGAIGPNQITPVETENDYWLPNCNFDCTIPGLSGVSYLALDALINGNGGGIADIGNWKISAINYLFEGGISSAVQYTLQQPFITGAPLANPVIFNAIGVLFEGGYALTNLYYQALANIAVLANNIPLVGEYLYRGIGSYLGPAFQTVDSVYDYSNVAGLSPGVLRYVLGVLTTPVTITGGPLDGVTLPFGNPNPYPTLPPELVAPVAALSSPVAAAKSASTDTGTATPAVVKAEVAEPKAGETPSDDSTPTDSTPAAGGSSEGTSTETVSDTTVPDTTVSDTKPADTKPADTTPAVDSPSSAVADSTADATPAATKPADAPAKAAKRPVRSAVERATKKIASAIGGAAAKAAPAAGGSADSGASAG